MHVCFSSWSCLTSASHCAVVSASVAVVLLSLPSTSAAIDLQSAMSSRLAAFWPMHVCFSSWSCAMVALVSFWYSAAANVLRSTSVSSPARASSHSPMSSSAAAESPTHFCFSCCNVSMAAVNAAEVRSNSASAILSLDSRSSTLSRMSAMSSVAAFDSPTHFCFSSWHILIEPSSAAVVFSSFAPVAFTVRSSWPTVFLHSAMSVSDCSDLPMHSALAACDALSEAESAETSASCFAAHVSTRASSPRTRFLLSSSRSPCA